VTRHQEAKQNEHAIIERLMSDEKSFQEYLKFSGKLFKYSFANSAMIFQQKPDAQMVAELKTWNKFGRYVNTGTKSITVFDENGKLRHLFNSGDTNGLKKIPNQWHLNNDFSDELLNELNNEYDLQHKNIEDSFSFLVGINTSDNLQRLNELLEPIGLSTEECNLLEKLFVSATKVMVNSRCDLDGSFGLETQTDLSAHALLSSKMTKEQFTDFCTIINETAKTSLLEIEKSLLTIIKKRRNENEQATRKDNLRERNDLRAGRGNSGIQSQDGIHGGSGGTETVGTTNREKRSGMDEVDI